MKQEGPAESGEEALRIVKGLMEHPLPQDLLIRLEVDAGVYDSWYEK